MGLSSHRELWHDYSNSLVVGKEYLVYGLETPAANASIDHETRPVPSVVILPHHGHFLSVPMLMFEVTDRRVSRFWVVHDLADGAMLLCPPILRELLHVREYSPGEEGDEEYFAAAEQAVTRLEPLLQAEHELLGS